LEKDRPGYIKAVFLTIDQGVNVIAGPLLNLTLRSRKFGFPDETLSSVFGKEVRAGNCKACYFICRALHILDKDHCHKSIEDDEGR